MAYRKTLIQLGLRETLGKQDPWTRANRKKNSPHKYEDYSSDGGGAKGKTLEIEAWLNRRFFPWWSFYLFIYFIITKNGKLVSLIFLFLN